eukprot:5777678-Prymnesium_polylepis.1
MKCTRTTTAPPTSFDTRQPSDRTADMSQLRSGASRTRTIAQAGLVNSALKCQDVNSSNGCSQSVGSNCSSGTSAELRPNDFRKLWCAAIA